MPSKWLSRVPDPEILADLPQGEPTKPSKPDSVGFVGADSRPASIIDAGGVDDRQVGRDDVSDTLVRAALDVVNCAGVRRFDVDGQLTIGIWQERDSAIVRHALTLLHGRRVRILHLEDHRVPERFRLWRPGDMHCVELGERREE
jgi:hypothetical protein